MLILFQTPASNWTANPSNWSIAFFSSHPSADDTRDTHLLCMNLTWGCVRRAHRTREVIRWYHLLAVMQPTNGKLIKAIKEADRLNTVVVVTLNGLNMSGITAHTLRERGFIGSHSHPSEAAGCCHGNRKWAASLQDGHQLVNGCIPQCRGVPLGLCVVDGGRRWF